MHLELQKQRVEENRLLERAGGFVQADKKIITPMQDALAPLALRMRSSRVIVEAVSQVNLEIHAKNHQNAFDEARDVILGFIQRRSGGGELPAEAMRGVSFTLDEISSRRVECVAINTPRYWTVRFDDDDKNVASRDWVIETAIADQEDGKSVLFGLRLQCVARGDNPAYERTIPAFVRNLIKKCDVRLDGRKLSFNPIIVDSEEDVEDLVDLLQSPKRRSDVIVLSLPEGSNDPYQTAISADGLLKNVAGAAHVAVITSDASFALSDIVGREFSVFRQAVRTYRPGFNPSSDEPFAHPLGLAHRIADFNGGPDGYSRFLMSEVLRRTVEARDSNKRMPTFAEAKRIAAELRRRTAQKSGSSERELLALAEEEIGELKQAFEKTKEEYTNILELAERERDNALAEMQRLKGTLHHLQNRMKPLENSHEHENIQLGGRKVELDRHLKKGVSREPRHCFRLYFMWDENTEQVIVGWLPSHLSTRAS